MIQWMKACDPLIRTWSTLLINDQCPKPVDDWFFLDAHPHFATGYHGYRDCNSPYKAMYHGYIPFMTQTAHLRTGWFGCLIGPNRSFSWCNYGATNIINSGFSAFLFFANSVVCFHCHTLIYGRNDKPHKRYNSFYATMHWIDWPQAIIHT